MNWKSNSKARGESSFLKMTLTQKQVNLRQDPFAEEDFEGHSQLTALVGDKA